VLNHRKWLWVRWIGAMARRKRLARWQRERRRAAYEKAVEQARQFVELAEAMVAGGEKEVGCECAADN
jgi:hypothetical protein